MTAAALRCYAELRRGQALRSGVPAGQARDGYVATAVANAG
jgi:hypothetical protein